MFSVHTTERLYTELLQICKEGTVNEKNVLAHISQKSKMTSHWDLYSDQRNGNQDYNKISFYTHSVREKCKKSVSMHESM